MKATKIIHRNETRIRVDFPYNREMVLKLRQIADVRWSKTMGAWHIPYTREAFEQLKTLFPDVEISPKNPDLTPTLSKGEGIKGDFKNENQTFPDKIENVIENKSIKNEEIFPQLIPKKQGMVRELNISIEITSKHIFIKIPKNEADIQYIRSYKYAQWDSNNYCWVIPNYGNNSDKVKAYFQSRNPEITEHVSVIEKNSNPAYTFTKNELLVVNYSNRTLKLFFSYTKDIVAEIKKIPLSSWNGNGHYWTIPYSDIYLGEIKQIAHQNSLDFIYHVELKEKIKARTSRHDIANYRECPAEYIAKLKELRYSENTLDTYRNMFEEFINHFPETKIDEITDTMIVDFLQYLVNERNISGSYQNQSINSIKFYYERVLGGQRKIYTIDRPRKEKFLPEVLSEEEIVKILNATENLKHKAIFMTIYSAGLRIGELINLKLKDIDSGRMQIRVEQAKGKKDRYTLLGEKTLEILRKYVSEYKPKVWLFEGLKGERYSTSSIQANLKGAVDKAGIKKRVTVHTLRHSFATHLLEAGTDIRYIQSLLGHQNSKTTEIYTHITTKGFDQIKSPLDKLNIK